MGYSSNSQAFHQRQQTVQDRARRRFWWLLLWVSAVLVVLATLMLLSDTLLSQSDAGMQSVEGVSLNQPVNGIRAVQVFGVQPHGDWFIQVQSGRINESGLWVHQVLDDDYPVILTSTVNQGYVIGFAGSGYHRRWFASVTNQSYFILMFDDGSKHRYDVSSIKTLASADPSLRQGVRGQLWVTLFDDDTSGSVGSVLSTRTVLIALPVS